MNHLELCSWCGRVIPLDAKPNSEYILLGRQYFHRACYLQEIGLEVRQ